MTPQEALPWLVVGYGVVCIAVGYVYGCQRAWLYLNYDASQFSILKTLLPSKRKKSKIKY